MPPTAIVEQNKKALEVVGGQGEPTFDELLEADSDKMASPVPEMLFTDHSQGLN